MSAVLKPKSETELADLIASAEAPFDIVGTGTKHGLGRPVQAAQTLDLSGFDGIAIYEPEELILEAGAGARLSEIEALIAASGQQLAFEPPDLSKLLGSAHSGTLGGLIACNLSGPRRIKAGAARDHVLGVRGVSGRGEVFKAGARVVKNVTGYDLPKLMTGSYGTLAALTSIIVKVLPRPEAEETLVIHGLSDAEAIAVMSLALQSACEVASAAHVPGQGTLLRLEGIPSSIAYRRNKLMALLGKKVEVLQTAQSAARWQAIRDVLPLADTHDRIVWRLSLTPSQAPAVVARLKAQLDLRYFYDWGGGLVWLDVPFTEDASATIIRSAIDSGHATLVRAPEIVRRHVEVFQPQPEALALLASRVKESFDPRRLFNPGRMTGAL